MKQESIEKLILTCLDTLRQMDLKESTIKRHWRHFNLLKDYMSLNGQNLYNETVGKKYQFDIFSEGNACDYEQSRIKNSIREVLKIHFFNFSSSRFSDQTVI